LRPIIIAALLVFCLTICHVASAITIASDGKAQAVIVVDPSATAPQIYAAGELRDFLNQVTGGSFTIVDKRAPSK